MPCHPPAQSRRGGEDGRQVGGSRGLLGSVRHDEVGLPTDGARVTSWSGCSASPHLGLYAEKCDVDTGRHLGNLPQAFSHLALIEAAARIIFTELRDELF
jgi:hypothetical protein